MAVAVITDSQRQRLQRSVFPTLTEDELDAVVDLCNRTGLDPFSKQIYVYKAWDRREGREIATPNVSIEGLRLIAQRTGEYCGNIGPQWCGKDGVWRDAWLNDDLPVAARCTVRRIVGGHVAEFHATSHWRESVQRNKEGKPQPMWAQKPALMLAKAAETLALKRGFPGEMSGIDHEDDFANEGHTVFAETARVVPAELEPAPADGPITQAQARLLHQEAKRVGMDGDTLADLVAAHNNGERSTRTLLASRYDDLYNQVAQYTAPVIDESPFAAPTPSGRGAYTES